MLESKIDKHYEIHSCSRICQGDILRDLKIQLVDSNNKVQLFSFPYLIILSQDCDLEQYFIKLQTSNDDESCNQFIPNIITLLSFPADQARNGNHLSELYTIKQQRINTDLWKIVKQNKNERYHFLPSYQPLQVPELLIDFKNYLTIPFEQIFECYKDHYLATVNELFREDLSQRFCNYLSRIGLPSI